MSLLVLGLVGLLVLASIAAYAFALGFEDVQAVELVFIAAVCVFSVFLVVWSD